MSKNSEATLLLKIKSAGDSVLSKTKAALGDLRTWAVAAFAALTSGAAVSAFKEAEEATNRLNQSLINQGLYTKELSSEYQKMASDLQSVTTFEDDAIKSAQAQMQSYLGQTKISKELMKATLDLAAAKKMDLGSAAEMVAKTIGTSTNALARQGVEIDKGATKTERMEKVLSVLQGRYGGMAEEQAKGLGALTQAKNAFGDLLEVVGEKFAPFIISGAKAVTSFANSIANNKDVIFWFEFALQGIAKWAATLKAGFMVLGSVILGTFTSIYTAVEKLAKGDLTGAWRSIKDGLSDTAAVVKEQYEQLNKDMESIDNVYVDTKVKAQETELRNFQESEDKKVEIRKKAQMDMEEFFKARSEDELNKLITQERLKNDQWLISQNQKIATEKDFTKKYELEKEKRKYLDDEYAKDVQRMERENETFFDVMNSKRVQNFDDTLTRIQGLQNSKNKAMVIAGKAAAIAHIGINTFQGSMAAYKSGVELTGEPLAGVALAGLVAAEGARQTANVVGIELAEGGIVKARPGGVRATIGEGGKDEAVIPLDRAGGMMGTQINLIVQGGFLGDRQQAREFATAVDQELFRLRQSNESMAFDKGII